MLCSGAPVLPVLPVDQDRLPTVQSKRERKCLRPLRTAVADSNSAANKRPF